MDAAVAAHGHAAAQPMDEAKVRLGMRFYVLTDIIFVAFLLVTYIWLRANNTDSSWFPQGTKLPDANTNNVLVVLMVLSGISYFVGYLGIRRGSQGQLRIGMLIALLLLIAALIGQIRYQGNLPFVTTDGSFASTFILLSSYHIYHLLIALFLGLGLTHRAFRGRYTQERMLGVVTIGYFWYWTVATPVLIWLMMMALPPKI